MIFEKPTRKQIAESRKIIDADPKTVKSNKSNKGYFTAIQYLAPAMESGFQTCSSASPAGNLKN